MYLHSGVVQSSYSALKPFGFEGVGNVPRHQKQTVNASLPSVCPGFQMGLVCPLVVDAMISVNLTLVFLRNTTPSQWHPGKHS